MQSMCRCGCPKSGQSVRLNLDVDRMAGVRAEAMVTEMTVVKRRASRGRMLGSFFLFLHRDTA